MLALEGGEGAAAPGVAAPELALSPSFDAESTGHLYHQVESHGGWLTRSVDKQLNYSQPSFVTIILLGNALVEILHSSLVYMEAVPCLMVGCFYAQAE